MIRQHQFEKVELVQTRIRAFVRRARGADRACRSDPPAARTAYRVMSFVPETSALPVRRPTISKFGTGQLRIGRSARAALRGVPGATHAGAFSQCAGQPELVHTLTVPDSPWTYPRRRDGELQRDDGRRSAVVLRPYWADSMSLPARVKTPDRPAHAVPLLVAVLGVVAAIPPAARWWSCELARCFGTLLDPRRRAKRGSWPSARTAPLITTPDCAN